MNLNVYRAQPTRETINMPENYGFEDLDLLLASANPLSQNEFSTSANANFSAGNGQKAKKRLQVAHLIADNDELVRKVKELEEQLQQLCSVQRTASEVTELYQQEKQRRIELERRGLEDVDRYSDLEKQLDVQKLTCEQLQEEVKTKCLPVDAKDMAVTFIQLAKRIAEDPGSTGLTRSEHNMLRKLREYCKLENISIPHPKSPTKKRAKAPSVSQTSSCSTQTLEVQTPVPQKPAMCSIAVQSENLVTKRDQGIQHKNTTTTRGTTTASFIKMHDVGTNFPEPKPALTAHQILDKMLEWTITPLSPIIDDFPDPEVPPMINVGTCTELCNVHREIDFLPDLPAQLKHSDSRPPSRAMFENIKDELAMPVGSAALDGYKELLSLLPNNQSVLAKMPPQVFEEVWQLMGQMVLVALQSRTTNSISQADFRSRFDTLIDESHQAHSIACESNESNLSTPTKDAVEMDVPIEQSTPEMGIDLTPIRLPPKPDFREKRRSKIKPKKKKQKPYSRAQVESQEKIIEEPRSPTETAVHFLTNLNAFQNSNCDNIDLQLNAEERQLLQLTAATANNHQSSVLAEKCTSSSPNAHSSDNMDAQLDAAENKPHPIAEPLDCKQVPDQLLTSFERDKEQFLSLFGSESDSEGEEAQDLCEPDHQRKLLSSEDDSNEEREDAAAVLCTTSKESDAQFLGSHPASRKDAVPIEAEHKELVERKGVTGRESDSQATTSEDEDTNNCSPDRATELTKVEANRSSIDKHQSTNESIVGEETNALATCGTSEVPVPPRTGDGSNDTDTNSPDNNNHSHQRKARNSDESPLCTAVETGEAFSDSDEDSSLVINDDMLSDSDEDQAEHSRMAVEMMSVVGTDQGESRLSSRSSSESEGDEAANSDSNEISNSDEASENLSPVRLPLGKRKRNTSTHSSPDSQPMEKRLTRYQAKQLSMLGADNHDPNKPTEEPQMSCPYDYSPMSPVDISSCEITNSEPVEIPLDSPGSQQNTKGPKALLCFMINAVKADAKQRGQRKQKPTKKQMEQLQAQIVDYLKHSIPLESTSTQLESTEDQVLIDTLITVYGELPAEAHGAAVNALERLLTLLRQLHFQRCSFIDRFMASLESRLFCVKERLSEQVAHKFVKLQLQLIGLYASMANPIESYQNPARLLLAKILYHYNKQMSSLVLEVLCHFPTVLPHREERGYDHSDPIITVMKHLLMCHQYNVTDPNGSDRALISKLRFEYHFQPFEPTKQQVIENLVEKVKAGRSQDLSYAFALFCRRSTHLNVANLLAEQLLPLANSYCDLCVQGEEYDGRMVCLLQCTSMIVKQLPLDGKPDISGYISLFKRILMAVPRPLVQEAAVQAILRLQRFGYQFVLEALQGYRPIYQLMPLTRAMLRSFVKRRQQFVAQNSVRLGS